MEEDGIRFKGTLHRSLSAAAMAASKDLGLGRRAQNGFLFSGLIEQAARASDPVVALEHAWERCCERATARSPVRRATTAARGSRTPLSAGGSDPQRDGTREGRPLECGLRALSALKSIWRAMPPRTVWSAVEQLVWEARRDAS